MNTHHQPADAQRTIQGITCSACGHSAVPADPFGCQRCGSHGDELVRREFSGIGTLLQSVLVHMHPDVAIPTPYAVGVVELDEGPILRVHVVGSSATAKPLSGQRGRLVANPVPASGAELSFEVDGTTTKTGL